MRLRSGIVVSSILATLSYCSYVCSQDKPQSPSATKPAAPAATAAAKNGATPAATTAKPAAVAAAQAPAETEDEKAVRNSAAAFMKAYNEHDSKALAALFAPKAEVIDENEFLVKGRDAIEQAFADVFKEFPNSSMKVEIESLRILTPNLAIEEGTTLAKNLPEDLETANTYVAIHVKIDGKWLLACVRDWPSAPPELTPHDHLLDLGFLVGEWVQESDDSIIHTNCHWSDNENFLLQDFKVQIAGRVAMSGTMRIGWDAVTSQFKSWVFDSHGGHAEGFWHQDGDAWIVKLQGATAKGETASSTNIYRWIDNDTVGWQSTHRVIQGERQDDINEIVIKRRPPTPGE